MDLAKTLIRSLVRAFYETKHVLVIDALMIHSALPTEDLAYLLGMQQKDLRKLCGKLREDRLLAVHTRTETREGFQRPINKDYYFIDFHATIDAIKYRVFNLTRAVESMYTRSEEKKDYYCPQCQAQWTQLEVLDKVSSMGFLCHRCNGLLERETPNEGDSTGHEKQSRLMSQLDGVLKLLKQIDSEDVPANDFNAAISLTVPVRRQPGTSANRGPVPINVDGSHGPPPAVKGITETSIVPLDVLVTAGTDKTAAEIAAEAQKKIDIAAQNALPVWHTTSTITGRTVALQKTNDHQPGTSDSFRNDEGEKKDSNVLTDELDAYYAQMAQEKEKEAREDLEDDESSGEEADDFEDVGIALTSPTPFAHSEDERIEVNNAPGSNDSGQIKDSESGSSAPMTNSVTPATLGEAFETESGPLAKRVKFEEQDEVEEGDTSRDSDEDQEIEFEDV